MAVLADAPLAYVRFSGTDVADVTGHAQLQRAGITIADGPTGIGAGAGAFTGADWLSITEDWFSLLGGNGAKGTFEAWVMLGSLSTPDEAIVSSDLTADMSWVAILASTQGLSFSRFDWSRPPKMPGIDAGSGAQGYPGPDPLLHAGTDQSFHLVAGTFGEGGCGMTFYFDGAEVGTNTDCVNITAAWPRILVGASSMQGTDAIHAAIADIAIYGSALSAARIQAHYQAAH